MRKTTLRLTALFSAMFAVWYVVMWITGFYDAQFHFFAAFSSSIMAFSGQGGGILCFLGSKT